MERTKWIKVSERLPPNGLCVETKVDDEKGCRNEQALTRANNLWFAGRMMVYYAPTHWRKIN